MTACVVVEFVAGWDASVDRAHLDNETNCIIIASDCSPILADGQLVAWNVFAKQPGTVALDVRAFYSRISTGATLC